VLALRDLLSIQARKIQALIKGEEVGLDRLAEHSRWRGYREGKPQTAVKKVKFNRVVHEVKLATFCGV